MRLSRLIGDIAYALAPVIRINDHLAIDFINQKATAGEQTVSLTPNETKLLSISSTGNFRTIAGIISNLPCRYWRYVGWGRLRLGVMID